MHANTTFSIKCVKMTYLIGSSILRSNAYYYFECYVYSKVNFQILNDLKLITSQHINQ